MKSLVLSQKLGYCYQATSSGLRTIRQVVEFVVTSDESDLQVVICKHSVMCLY